MVKYCFWILVLSEVMFGLLVRMFIIMLKGKPVNYGVAAASRSLLLGDSIGHQTSGPLAIHSVTWIVN